MRTTRQKSFGLLIVAEVFLLLAIAFTMLNIGEPKHFTVSILSDTNSTGKLKALFLYQKRFNKYGGADNTEMRLELITKAKDANPTSIAVIDIREKSPLLVLDENKTFKIDKLLEVSHLNYRVSAVVSDCDRKLNLKPDMDALQAVKALDIIVSSLPERLGDLEELWRVVQYHIPQHHYFSDIPVAQTRVYTGIAMNKIIDIDMSTLVYKMDFFLWFRWDGDENITVDDIEFTNTSTPSFLKDSNTSSLSSVSLVSSIRDGNTSYVKYRIIGEFNAIEHKNYALGEQNLPIRFRHKFLGIEHIHYVRDSSDTSHGIFTQDKPKTLAEWEKLRFDVIADPVLFLNYTLSYSIFTNRVALGDPTDINDSTLMSSFTMRYAVKHVLFSVRGVEGWVNSLFPLGEGRIHVGYMIIYLLFSIMLNLGLSYLRKQRVLRQGWSHTAWVANLLIIFAMLLSLEFLASQLIFDLKLSAWGVENLDIIETIMSDLAIFIALLWWLIPAYYTTSAFEQFLWCPIEERTGTEIPHVLRMFIIMIVYTLALIGILAYVFEVTTSSLMATSGAFAILFAILSKVDISNIVAGLGISFAKVFKLGDWVKIDGIEGKVVEMTPRSTKILTFDNSVVNIPNTNVGSAIIENMVHPTGVYRLFIHLEIVPDDIERVEKVLMEAVDFTGGVLKSPRPFINFLGQGDSAQIYEVYFFIEDYSLRAYFEQAVWRSVWVATEKHHIEMATPQREHFNFEREG